MGFTIEGVIFMSCAWIILTSIIVFCYKKIFKKERAKRNE